MNQVFRTINTQNSIDKNRVFAVGHSSGGFFTLSLMENLPNLFRGFVALGAYARYKVEPESVKNLLKNRAKPIPLNSYSDHAVLPRPVLYMFGTKDKAFRNDFPKDRPWWDPNVKKPQITEDTLEQLAVRNRCNLPNPIKFNAQWNEFDTRHDCTGNGKRVSWYVYDDDHSWPEKANVWAVNFLKRL